MSGTDRHVSTNTDMVAKQEITHTIYGSEKSEIREEREMNGTSKSYKRDIRKHKRT